MVKMIRTRKKREGNRKKARIGESSFFRANFDLRTCHPNEIVQFPGSAMAIANEKARRGIDRAVGWTSPGSHWPDEGVVLAELNHLPSYPASM